MKGAILFLLLAMVVLMGSCGKDDDGPKFTSAEGTWTYTTPEDAISIDFTITKNGNSFSVVQQVMRIEGVECESIVQANNVEATTIGSMRINANDSKVTYAYFILFTDAEVSGDFTEIKVPGVTYTWPFNKTNNLTDITITRK